MGVLLDAATASDVPYFDALPTAASLVATWLLAQRYAENWLVWLCVNTVSVALFAWKALWPTVGLYAVFALLSWVGWRQWRRAQGGRT
jgi:nicotinamide mononucleotide transporter